MKLKLMEQCKGHAPILCLLGIVLLLVGCSKEGEKTGLFTRIHSTHSGISFINQIEIFENDSLNALEYDVLFNGAGVGIGDFDNDGLQDVFFAGNLVSSKLYLNKGEFKFEDITEKAGVTTNKWCTGVSVADVNQDGLLDLYLSVAHAQVSPELRSNLLFINQGVNNGVPTFKEMASVYGLDDDGFSIQAAFFDFDKDGDLDCYVLTNAMEKIGRNRLSKKNVNGQGESNDRLYENIGKLDGHPQFRDISSSAGILKDGHGLGLCVTDLDQDGWLDIYCANDFVSNDLVWMNNGDGTFTDRSQEFLRLTSFNSMGVDIQDFNNDGLSDICVVDMLPESEHRRKMMVMKTNTDFFKLSKYLGYQDEYVRNVLQLNQGPRSNGALAFSEIGQLSGIHATDWSWAPLLADLDNDGLKDLIVSNGYRRDITNLDYVVYLNQKSSVRGLSKEEARMHRINKLYELPEVKLQNYLYRNLGNLRFEDVSELWGISEKNYSNGAAYADLDNDGDLDLVFNNIDSEAGLYRNELFSLEDSTTGKVETRPHYVKVRLVSTDKAIGAKVRISAPDGTLQYQENLPVRGYMSSVDPVLLFGLGEQEDFSLAINWADGTYQEFAGLSADTLYSIEYQPEYLRPKPPKKQNANRIFRSEVADSVGISYRHEEIEFNELKRTFSLHQQYNRQSPGIAVADLDGNGLDDIFIGADPGKLRVVYLQKEEGSFEPLPQGSNQHEDMGALFFDVDKDGDSDLYVVSGGSHASQENEQYYRDRMYLNDGKGNLVRAEGLIPQTAYSGSVITAADFDRDGDLDLFRGSRVTAGQYPKLPDNYLFVNNDNTFSDLTDVICPDLKKVGMVTAALWSDYNQDGWFDLIVVGEFMPVVFFKNEQGKLVLDQNLGGELPKGWWNSISPSDIDLDGDTDYILGNLGLNSQYRASAKEPLRVYAADYDSNGTIDPIFTYYKEGREVPVMVRDVLHEQLPSIINKRFGSYDSYSHASITDILNPSELERSTVLEATEMSSGILVNLGAGRFEFRILPLEAQMAPVYGSTTDDFNGDGFPDLLLVGNSGAFETYTGPYSASMGTLLLGDGKGDFRAVPPVESGLYLEFDQKALASVYTGGKRTLIVTSNNGKTQWLENTSIDSHYMAIKPMEATVLIHHIDGSVERKEIGYGSGYLSQSSRGFYFIKERVKRLEILDYSGKQSRIIHP